MRRKLHSNLHAKSKFTDKNGYIQVYYPKHPAVNRSLYIPLHRLVVENKIGRYLEAHEVVHHVDGNKENNKPDNLAVMTQAKHARIHKTTVVRPSFAKLKKLVSKYTDAEIAGRYGVNAPVVGNWRRSLGILPVRREPSRPSRQVLKQLLTEKPVTEIAKELGVSYPRVIAWCDLYGLARTKPGGSWRKLGLPPRKLLFKDVWTWSLSKLGRRYDCSAETVHHWCVTYKLDCPPRGYWNNHAQPKLEVLSEHFGIGI